MFATDLQQGLDPQLVGAKSANLGRAMELGFSVPAGGILTRRALHLFLEEAGLLQAAQHLIDSNGRDRALWTRAYETLCKRVLAAPIPRPVMEAMTPIAERLLARASHGLAVRSSGVHEDSTKASFAGVYDSFLCLRSQEDLWMAVRRCWCGYWSPRAIDYARKMGVNLDVDGMAVLLQILVNADSAGILFTANPRTGNPWEFVLESCFGLARDLVASTGAMSVDHFLLEWDTGEILHRSIGEKKTVLVVSKSGLDCADMPVEIRKQPALSDEMATRIAQLGLGLDRAFGCRVDIEWAMEVDRVHIVQVRPITALPPFFPHHLPTHLADCTWLPAPQWHFAFRTLSGKVMPPLYRDTLIMEKYNRYLQIGPIEMPVHRRAGAELDFHGYRYIVAGKDAWPGVSADQLEQYLIEHEPQMRRDFLESIYKRLPAVGETAVRLQQEAMPLTESIEAMLWAREEMWEYFAITAGPSQWMFGICEDLLDIFVNEHLPDVDVADLVQGHHPDLDPYFPEVQVAEAEAMAQLLEPERQRFEHMGLPELVDNLMKGKAPASFIEALEDYCERFGLLPPSRFVNGVHDGPTMPILRLIRNALKGGRRVAEMNAQATRQRERSTAAVREALAGRPDLLLRFEHFHDWALFWGPALNSRAWANITWMHLIRFWNAKCRSLQELGLLDDPDEIGYFTVEDLKTIAQTQSIEVGRGLWRRRRLEYERYDRLDSPDYLGRPPKEKDQPARRDEITAIEQQPASATIIGKPAGPGRSQGTVRRVQSLQEGDEAREEDVVVIVTPIQSRTHQTSILFSLMLRVRGLVVPDDPMMWMHHVGQIARECGTPIVQISHEDIARISDGYQIDVDGSRGTITLLYPA